jgi:putative ABC transport system permease protein
MRFFKGIKKRLSSPYFLLIRFIGMLVPRRLRAGWRQEWDAELRYREMMLAEWDRLNWRNKLNLFWHSTTAFWDVLWLQPGRLEDEMFQDLRFGLRMLLKRKSFSAVALLTLMLGIGASTAIFSVVHTVLLRPLPFAAQEQLVMLWKRDTTANTPFVELALAEVRDWQQQSQSFTDVAAMPATVYGYGYVLTGRGDAVQLESSKVSGSFFSLLGVQPAYGRIFNESDDQVNGQKVVILSDRVWRERFDADANIIGQSIILTEEAFTVLGVMPAKFEFPKGVDLWVPIKTTMPARTTENYGATFLLAVGRLKPGVTAAQAETEMNTVIAGVAQQHPESEANGHRIVITPLATHLFGDARPALWLLLLATGMLLLIACANIANLSLAHATARRREFAVRSALGAGRFRLIRQLLSESFLLALGGGIGGVVLSQWLIKFLIRVAPDDIPRMEEVGLNLTVLFFSLVITLLTAIFCGLIPALSVSRLKLNQTLQEGGSKMSGERSSLRTRRALVIAEVAVTVILLSGATLILRSFVNLSQVDIGFHPANVLTMHLRVQGAKYSKPEARREFYRQLIERLEAQPGIEAASAVLIRPMEGTVGWDTPFALEGQSDDEVKTNRVPNFEAITPHYFRTFGIPIKVGRAFTEQDTDQSPSVVIISETMAKTLFAPGVDPLGKRLKLGLHNESWRTIIGVAGDVRYRELQDIRFDLYIPFTQWERAFVNHFAVRTTTEPKVMLATVRREVAALDPAQSIARVATMDELVGANLAQPRFSAVLLNWLSGLALMLAAVGIYGVLVYGVAQRTGEFGIRRALGAQGFDILKLVIGQGMRLVAVGLALGLVASLGLTRLMTKLLFGISPSDPLTFAGIALLLTVVALVACWLPARRAARVDPLVALRHE